MNRSRLAARWPVAWVFLIAIVGGPAWSQDAGILGDWTAVASKDGTSASVGLNFARGSDEKIAVRVSLPVIHIFEVPEGTATVQGSEVKIGSWILTYDAAAGTLGGELPAATVPVYHIPVTFHRGVTERPPRPALTAPTAAPLWTFTTGAPVYSDLAYAQGMVFVGAEDGRLHALDGKTGQERWSFKAGGPIRAPATVADQDLYVPADDGFLYKLGAKSGKEVWRVRTEGKPIERIPPGPKSRYDQRASGVTVAGGRLYLGTHDGHVVALDPQSGARVWDFAAGDTVLSTPAVDGGRVFFGSYDGNVYAVDATRGTLDWKHPTGAPVTSKPAVFQGRVIVGSRSYDVLALDERTGEPAWTRYLWFSWIESPVAVRDGVGYVGSSDAARLSAFEALTGKSVWSLDVHGWAWGEPVVTARRVYIGLSALGGYPVPHEPGAVAVDRQSGKPVWRWALEVPKEGVTAGVAGSAAGGEGRVFFGAVDGRVCAFAE